MLVAVIIRMNFIYNYRSIVYREKLLKHFLVLPFVCLQWQVNLSTKKKLIFDREVFTIAAGLGNAVSDVMGIG